LKVGSSREEVQCHRALLAYYSSVFERALYGSFAEADQEHMDLPEDSIDDVQTLAKWIYSGLIDPSDIRATTRNPTKPLFLEKLWIFGDKIGARTFVQCITDMLLCKYRKARIPVEAVGYVYNHTLPESTLRKILIGSVTAEGPLHPRFMKQDPQRTKEWQALILGGGQFVLDVVMKGGFCIWEDYRMAACYNRYDYLDLDFETPPSAKTWGRLLNASRKSIRDSEDGGERGEEREDE